MKFMSVPGYSYRKTPKFSDTQTMLVIILKFEQCGSTTE